MIQSQNIGFKQIAQGFVALLLLIVFVWVAFYALIFVLVLSVCLSAFFFVRRFLRQQGILKTPENPFDVAPEQETREATVIEGEYIEVSESAEENKRDTD